MGKKYELAHYIFREIFLAMSSELSHDLVIRFLSISFPRKIIWIFYGAFTYVINPSSIISIFILISQAIVCLDTAKSDAFGSYI